MRRPRPTQGCSAEEEEEEAEEEEEKKEMKKKKDEEEEEEAIKEHTYSRITECKLQVQNS